MTVAETPVEQTPAAPPAEEAPVNPLLQAIEADPQSESLDDEIFPTFGETPFDEAAREQKEDLAAQPAAEEDGSSEEGEADAPLSAEEQLAQLKSQYEELQKWTQRVSSDNGRLQKRLDNLDQDREQQTTQAEQDQILAELEQFDEADFQDPARLNRRLITVADRLVEEKAGKKLKELDSLIEEQRLGLQYTAGFMQAGEHAQAVQNAVAHMANHYAQQNPGRQLQHDYPPEQVLAGAWQLVQGQLSQNTTAQTPTPDANVQQAQEPVPTQPAQAPPQQAPQPPVQQQAAPFTPEQPSVGLSSGAVTAATTGRPRTIRDAVAAGMADTFGE